MAPTEKTKLAVLASGRGSNFQALIDAVRAKKLEAEIVILLSDKPGAPALDRAKEAGIPTAVVKRSAFASRDAMDAAVASRIRQSGATLVALAGYMRILSGAFLRNLDAPVINIHPSLLPAFPGLDAQKQALDAGATRSGCTVHFVDEGVDTGPIIMQATVPIKQGDTVESLSARILEQEHLIYPKAVAAVMAGKVTAEK